VPAAIGAGHPQQRMAFLQTHRWLLQGSFIVSQKQAESRLP